MHKAPPARCRQALTQIAVATRVLPLSIPGRTPPSATESHCPTPAPASPVAVDTSGALAVRLLYPARHESPGVPAAQKSRRARAGPASRDAGARATVSTAGLSATPPAGIR